MTALLILSAALAGSPVVEGAWKKGAAWLTVRPPAGEHINAAGPLSGKSKSRSIMSTGCSSEPGPTPSAVSSM